MLAIICRILHQVFNQFKTHLHVYSCMCVCERAMLTRLWFSPAANWLQGFVSPSQHHRDQPSAFDLHPHTQTHNEELCNKLNRSSSLVPHAEMEKERKDEESEAVKTTDSPCDWAQFACSKCLTEDLSSAQWPLSVTLQHVASLFKSLTFVRINHIQRHELGGHSQSADPCQIRSPPKIRLYGTNTTAHVVWTT